MPRTTSAPGPRARGERRDRRQAIVDAALALAAEKPFDEVTVAEVARRAGVSHGLLFYYFADKWAITTEALAQLLAGLDAVQAPRPEEATLTARIEGLVRRHIEYLAHHRVSYRALMHGAAIIRPDVRSLVDGARRKGVDDLAALLDLPTPRTPLDDLKLWSWLAVLDTCTERVLSGDDLDADAVIAWAAEQLLRLRPA